jgi:hypothetical protein
MPKEKVERYSAHLVLLIAPPLLLVVSGSTAWAQAPGDGPADSAATVAGGTSPCATGGCVSAAPRESAPAPESAPFVASPFVASPFVAPAPRLDLAVTSFAIGNGSASTVPLQGLELDLYAVTSSWLRGGFTLAAGRGNGTIMGTDVGVRYGMLGVEAALQFPMRLAPFIQANLAGGVLAGSLDGALSIPGTSVSLTGGTGATWIYTRGADLGVHLYALGSLHLTASVGWVRATWHAPDAAAMVAAQSASLRFKDVTNDSLITKLGIGF